MENKIMLNNCIVYKASKWEILASKILPYYIPFISKRKRVIIRKYWRNRWRRKLHNDLCKVLSKPCLQGLLKPTKEIKWYDWEREIITNNNS